MLQIAGQGAGMKIVYCAYGGQKYADQLAQSAGSVLAQHPRAQIIVYTTADFLPLIKELPVETRLVPHVPQDSDWHDPFMKVRSIAHVASQAEPFLYLDNDTYVAGSLADAWPLTAHFDCMGVHSPISDQRAFLGLSASGLKHPPADVFPEWNGGVLFFAGTKAAQRIADRWLEVLELRISGGGDQWPLAQALWDSGARLHVLPAVYNCRLPAAPVVYGPIRILHSDHTQLADIAHVLNEGTGLRQVKAEGHSFVLAPVGSDDERMF
jgi:hypothetical protein